MTTVFVAGSRAISKLNEQITERLDNIMRRQLSVLVGDANGADKAVQAYLAKCAYRSVTVYSMEASRNNVGGWPIKRHFGAPSQTRPPLLRHQRPRDDERRDLGLHVVGWRKQGHTHKRRESTKHQEEDPAVSRPTEVVF